MAVKNRPLTLSCWINLRAAAGDNTGDLTNTAEPPNWPDKWCGKKAFVMVHGYSVKAKGARAWGAEMWKRFYWSGSNAKFHMVTWLGDHGILPTGVPYLGEKTPDYWLNVYNAFLTSPALKDEVAKIKEPVYIAGHSLGNMVISSAMADHGMKVQRYYMVDAAVPCEAYDSTVRRAHESYMTQTEWRDKSPDLKAARYADLFDSNDNRSMLTWQGRFSKLDKSLVHQLYSSGEDVLEPNHDGVMPGPDKYRAWVGQETQKGLFWKRAAQWLSSLTSINEPYEGFKVDAGGWSQREPQWSNPPLTIEGKKTSFVFNPMNNYAGGASVHEANGSQLLKDWNKRGTPGYTYLAILLAQDVPALSWPAGSVAVGKFAKRTDMMSLNTNGWPEERLQSKYPKDKNLRHDRWWHSDIKEVSYLYVHRFYDLVVNDGVLQR